LSRLAAEKFFFSYSVDWQQKFVDERVVLRRAQRGWGPGPEWPAERKP